MLNPFSNGFKSGKVQLLEESLKLRSNMENGRLDAQLDREVE